MTSIEFVSMIAETDFSEGSTEARNRKGQTLAEYIDEIKAVHATLKADLFYHMGHKRKAKDVAVMRLHGKRVEAISQRLASCARIARHYGVILK